jgi:hypothetical protein
MVVEHWFEENHTWRNYIYCGRTRRQNGLWTPRLCGATRHVYTSQTASWENLNLTEFEILDSINNLICSYYFEARTKERTTGYWLCAGHAKPPLQTLNISAYIPTHHLKLCRDEMSSRMWVYANLLLAHVNNLNCAGSGRLDGFFPGRSDQCATWHFSQQNTTQSSKLAAMLLTSQRLPGN